MSCHCHLTPLPANGTFYYHRDHQGSIVALTDSTGQVVESFTYDNHYGSIVNHTKTTETNNPYAYTGRELDTDELYYYRARYYDPSLERFLGEDPIGFSSGDFNWYRYVGNQPSRLIDSYGLTSLYVDIKNGTMYIRPKDDSTEYYTMPVTSGRDSCTNKPTCDTKPNIGPIPSGNYYANANDLTNPGILGDVLRNFRGDWGDWRVPLNPKKGTNTHGRSGFFLHGGALPGSAGCIDFGGGPFGNGNTDRLLSDLLNDPNGIIPVIVF